MSASTVTPQVRGRGCTSHRGATRQVSIFIRCSRQRRAIHQLGSPLRSKHSGSSVQNLVNVSTVPGTLSVCGAMGTGLAVCSPAVTMVTSLPLCSPAVTMKTGLPLCSPAVSMGAGLPLCRHYGDWFTSLPSLWNWFTSLSSLWGLVYLSVALPSLWGLGYLSAVTMGTGLPLCCHYGDRATSLLSLWTQGDLSAVTMGTELRLCCLCELPFCGVCGRCRYQIPSL